MSKMVCMMGTNESTMSPSSLELSDRSKKRFFKVDRYLKFSFASFCAIWTSFYSLLNGVVYVLLFCSRNLRTFLMRSELSWMQMLLRFSDLFCQKSSSVIGSGCLPSFNEFSGSCLRTFLICFCQWIMAAIFKLKPLNLTFKYVGLIFAGGTLAVGGVGGR